MEFSRQEYWSGLPFHSPGDLPDPWDWTWVSRIAGRRFALWATREPTTFIKPKPKPHQGPDSSIPWRLRNLQKGSMKLAVVDSWGIRKAAFSIIYKCKVKCVLKHLSCVWLIVMLWMVACQAPLYMGFSRQEYWNALPYPPPGDLPNPGVEPTSLTFPASAGAFFTTSAIWEDPKWSSKC